MPLFTITIIYLDCYWYFCVPFCGMLVELINFAHRLFYICTRGLVLQQLKTPYITRITAIELNSHWYVILPFCRLKANETSRNNFCQVMADNRVTVVVSNKFLQIDDISSEFEFLNNYLLLYILIRFIISVCFLSLDYCINTRLFSMIGRISQSLILLSFEIFFTLPVLKSITFSMKWGSSL